MKTKVEHKYRKLLYRVTYFFPEYFPIHEEEGSGPIYLFIKDRIEELIKGKDAVFIDRTDFESHLNKRDDLSEAYLDLFSTKAIFYKCRFEYDGIQIDYYIMVEKRIRLIYYRKVELKNGDGGESIIR
ncbi:MAG: hypothetical protein IPJ86_10585 [Bacteroidetes bacterium]|nr:hypothetical protein [Bacteroidota bacterium]